MSGKSRLDLVLVERGLFISREKAQRAIMAGEILVDGQPATKAGTPTAEDADITVAGRERYVGRGGLKIEKALAHFQVDATDRVGLDVGSSTGGFTDCLLQHGSRLVYAVDVGHGQLDWGLRNDPRVVVREGVNARFLTPEDFDPRPDLVVSDVSFISLTLILPAIFSLIIPPADILVLIKPQFELTRAEVGKGGIVRDEAARLRAVEKIHDFTLGAGGAWLGSCESPITGRDGNVEFLAHIRPPLP